MEKDRDDANEWKFKGTYNDNVYSRGRSPYGIVINYGLVNDFMKEWCLRKQQLRQKEITQIQYDNWKWNWPYSCDSSRSSESYVDWMTL